MEANSNDREYLSRKNPHRRSRNRGRERSSHWEMRNRTKCANYSNARRIVNRYRYRPLFPQQSIDPEEDREIVAKAVDFVVSSSTKGCIALITKFAEHLKYTLSIEQKLDGLEKELSEWKRSKLVEEQGCPGQGTTCKKVDIKDHGKKLCEYKNEFLLPNVPDNPRPFTVPEKDLKVNPRMITLTTSADVHKDLQSLKSESSSLPLIINHTKLSHAKKHMIDSSIQTMSEKTRTPLTVERACSPVVFPKTEMDINQILQEQLKIACANIGHLPSCLTNKTVQDFGTQTDNLCPRHVEVMDRASSPVREPEKSTQAEQPLASESYEPDSQTRIKRTNTDRLERLKRSEFSKGRSNSLLSHMTDSTVNSYPGVKRREKCRCSTCVKVRKGKSD